MVCHVPSSLINKGSYLLLINLSRNRNQNKHCNEYDLLLIAINRETKKKQKKFYT